jgi:hypothetical protein
MSKSEPEADFLFIDLTPFNSQAMKWKISISKIMCCGLDNLIRFPSESLIFSLSRPDSLGAYPGSFQ